MSVTRYSVRSCWPSHRSTYTRRNSPVSLLCSRYLCISLSPRCLLLACHLRQARPVRRRPHQPVQTRAPALPRRHTHRQRLSAREPCRVLRADHHGTFRAVTPLRDPPPRRRVTVMLPVLVLTQQRLQFPAAQLGIGAGQPAHRGLRHVHHSLISPVYGSMDRPPCSAYHSSQVRPIHGPSPNTSSA